jgi:hypothetical protein
MAQCDNQRKAVPMALILKALNSVVVSHQIFFCKIIILVFLQCLMTKTWIFKCEIWKAIYNQLVKIIKHIWLLHVCCLFIVPIFRWHVPPCCASPNCFCEQTFLLKWNTVPSLVSDEPIQHAFSDVIFGISWLN